MKTAVLSCGPSIANMIAPLGYDLVIGVNWTATRWACDWVCCHDGEALDQQLYTPRPQLPNGKRGRGHRLWLGNPHWFLHWHALDQAGNLYLRPDILEDLREAFVMTWPASCPDIPYSGLSPLVLMGILGIDKADLFGYDMHGATDARDLDNPTRTPERWDRERQLFEELTARYNLRLNIVR